MSKNKLDLIKINGFDLFKNIIFRKKIKHKVSLHNPTVNGL